MTRTVALAVAMASIVTTSSAATSAKAAYTAALVRERGLRASLDGKDPDEALEELHTLVTAYRAIVRRYPTSGFSDNALWHAAALSGEAFTRFGKPRDREIAVRLLRTLADRYPHSSLASPALDEIARWEAAAVRSQTAAGGPIASQSSAGGPIASQSSAGAPIVSPKLKDPAGAPSPDPPPAAVSADRSRAAVVIHDIKRTLLPDVVRVTVELDEEVPYHDERLGDPPRMFIDLQKTRPSSPLVDATLTFEDDLVRQIRVGRHPNNTTRIVIDLAGVGRYSVFALYNPYRLVIDCERPLDSQKISQPAAMLEAQPPRKTALLLPARPLKMSSARLPRPRQPTHPAPAVEPAEASSAEAPPHVDVTVLTSPPTAAPPVAPSANLEGGFSLARQLGLTVSRIVIDPGHGGHDPGAQGKNLSEAELVLDVALRLEKLLKKQPGVEVVLTRRTDEFIALQERTEIANRDNADLFLSIHANASTDQRARGIETYFLNFASNPEAALVASRENASSGRAMNNLPDLVRAIALNNKLDESRDFATLVQRAMLERLRGVNKGLRDLGVKKAPFVVLIGAQMPSVLAEISFVTNRQEGQLLRASAYRQRVAEALLNGIIRYTRSLKSVGKIAAQ